MDIGSLYTDYYSKAANDAKTSRLSTKAKEDLSGSSDEELMEVCKDFESYFVEQVLKQAMDAFTDGEESSSGAMNTLQSYYKDGLVREYAGKITEDQDMGLAKILFEQMKRNYSTDKVKPANETNTENTDKTDIIDDTSATEAVMTAYAKEE